MAGVKNPTAALSASLTISLTLAVVAVGYLYVTCLIQNCSDKLVTAQFLGKIDHGSLLVQDDYIFVKVNKQTKTQTNTHTHTQTNKTHLRGEGVDVELG